VVLRRRRRSAPGRERGAVAVEAALTLPIIVVLLLGITDLGFLLRDQIAITAFARVGARTASALPRYGTTTGHAFGPSFARSAADAMARSSDSLPREAIDYIWIYLANDQGYPSQSLNWQSDTTSEIIADQSPPYGVASTNCQPQYCLAYRWVDGTPGRFELMSTHALWDPVSINACRDDPSAPQAMSVGVYVQATHRWVGGLFPGGSTKVKARTVMKFEPVRPDFPGNPDPTEFRPPGCQPGGSP
jgi:Flp pilus assembly protein TadG